MSCLLRSSAAHVRDNDEKWIHITNLWSPPCSMIAGTNPDPLLHALCQRAGLQHKVSVVICMELPNLKTKAGSRLQEEVSSNLAGEETQKAGEERSDPMLLSVSTHVMPADLTGRAELSRTYILWVILRGFGP